ncbi:YdcF family protein [Ureibacillus sinduriensis]|uniref:DUF218 domain-containing protein n=1 Tax=Ureibacillus sinduriensis BLB-1 = JCM 15800 TaxID=1384057 RepID=A0A0A3HNL5_9BACL|nr:YdcF family protein [Ureibacillus sinduriensis]KGR73979.1 hypothetical protein CD33_18405 [Ureibacillus sinduriensis BLB-1 = JCM 15800]
MKLKTRTNFILLIVVSIFICLFFAKDYLVVNEEPTKSDVIIVLSGAPGRLEKAASLYHEGYAEKVMLTTSRASGLTKENALALGISDEAVILEEEATSTYTNALYARETMEKSGLDSAIVVTSDYHTRRSKLSFDRVFSDSRIEYSIVASPTDGELGGFSNQMAFKEYFKLVGYIFGFYRWIDL